MIIKATKQLGSFKRGINLYVPNNRRMSTAPGLYGIRYVGYFDDDVNWFAHAAKQGDNNQLTEINNFSSSPDTQLEELYSWEWIGYFKPSTTEQYTFYTFSDDASYLWIGDNALNGYTTSNATVNNGGLHGGTEQQGSISLNANQYYPIRIQFGENTGGDIMTVSFSTPTISKTTNGANYYSYNISTNGF